MIQGTMSNAGKSLLCAGLCRIFRQDGYKVAPFKSQNMALNSFITEDGLEMGRAQVVQAEAAGIPPQVEMNPILLKPTNDVGSQVIVNGEVLKNMSAREYFAYKKQLVPDIMKAFHKLEEENDIIVIEGAGSPAEINLKKDDIVNMGLAKMVDAPVLLVGDIDRGGVFAQLLGTLMLLEEDEKQRVKGLIINKFRGDKTILDPGIVMLEERGQIPVVGVTPYMQVEIEDEDSLTERFEGGKGGNVSGEAIGLVDIAVIRTPRISNFTDFMLLENAPGVNLRYVKNPRELGEPDMIILPGTKNTMGDLKWLRQSGMEGKILKAHAKGCVVWGICGGYQMLGQTLSDPEGVEDGGSMKGFGLLPVETTFTTEKTRTRINGRFVHVEGILEGLQNVEFEGYEIHMGQTRLLKGSPMNQIHDTVKDRKKDGSAKTARRLEEKHNGNGVCHGNMEETGMDGISHDNAYGTYIHGIFDKEEVVTEIVKTLAEKKGLSMEEIQGVDLKTFKESQYDLLADTLRNHLDIDQIYEIIGMRRKGRSYTLETIENVTDKNHTQTKIEIENVLPTEIEKRSFEIITEELKQEKIFLPDIQAPITKRCIHTSADFDYAKNLVFSEHAVEKALDAIRNGASIVTDTQMGKSGINKKRLEQYGGQVYCFMSDEDVAQAAKKNGTTRAVASMEKACELDEKLIFAIGNAPTALIHLYELIRNGRIKPELVIGVPVGFVNVVQSKELILTLEDIPYIVARGRKGGSNIAACICNALIYML